MKVVGKKTLWKGKFLETNMISYRDRNGIVRDWEAAGRVDCNGVVVVMAVTDSNELVLIRQYRPALDAYVIEPTAGLVDPGEEDISAARRELIEETGYISENIEPLTEGVMSTGIDIERWCIFLAQNARRVSEEIKNAHPPDDNEDIETIVIPFNRVYETLEKRINAGEKVDLRIFGLWELTRRKLNIQ